MVGSAIWERWQLHEYTNLSYWCAVMISETKQEVVIYHEGNNRSYYWCCCQGILANTPYPYQLLWENMQIQNNLINSIANLDGKKSLFSGSCISIQNLFSTLKENNYYRCFGNQWVVCNSKKITGVKHRQAIRRQFGRDGKSATNSCPYWRDTSHVLPAMMRGTMRRR
jgi:hypothetical protein